MLIYVGKKPMTPPKYFNYCREEQSGLAYFLPEPKAGKGKSALLVPTNVDTRKQIYQA